MQSRHNAIQFYIRIKPWLLGQSPDQCDLRDIDTAAEQVRIEGARYPEAIEKRTGR